jgi:phosphohistidine swiveling domain-containing protein
MISFRRSDRAWKQINYRAATCVLTAEFLHGLYQRHDPFVNPIKFASTRVVFRPWQAISYAPSSEWDLLGLRFGGRLLRELDRCEVEIRRTLGNPRQRARNLADALDAADLSRLSDDSLGDLLVEAHHTPLGDIYEVNLVQVEHALHVALRSRLAALRTVSEAQIDATIANLVFSTVPSCASYEERDFLRLVLEIQGNGHERVRDDPRLVLLAERQRAVGAAYGAGTASVSDLQHRLEQFAAQPRSHIEERLRKLESDGASQEPHPAANDECCRRLIALLRDMGAVRDRNKALMGRISRHRDRFLEEIARRRDVEVSQLRLYLLEELLDLLDDFHRVPHQVVEARATRGMVFSRREDVTWGDVDEGGRHDRQSSSSGRTLSGLCASPGVHSGPVRIVHAASDLKRMRLGDVLVAPGTDFDLAFLIQMAGAVVTEEGGLLSHAAVLTRELSIPCLISVSGATTCLVEDEWVEVDATAGQLKRVARPHGSSRMPRAAATAAAAGPCIVPVGDAESVAVGGRKAQALALLARHGFDVPRNLYVVPTTVCEQIASELAQQLDGTLHRVVAAIAERFRPGRISLRSSTTLEDAPDRSAAGVFESVVDVEAQPEDVMAALRRVLDGLRGHVAHAYSELTGPQVPCAMAILVSPYVECELQGASYSESVWDRDTVLVEWFESPGRGGCPVSGGTLVEFSRSDLQREHPGPAVASFVHDLRRVANVTLAVERVMGTPVQLEWGVHGHRIVVFQARPVVTAARARRREPCPRQS